MCPFLSFCLLTKQTFPEKRKSHVCKLNLTFQRSYSPSLLSDLVSTLTLILTIAILYPPAVIRKWIWLFKFLLYLTAEQLRNEGPHGDDFITCALLEGTPSAVSLTLPQIENTQLCKTGHSVALLFPMMEHSGSA